MANWGTPSLTDLYADFLAYLKDRDVDLAKMFDGVGTNVPTGAIGYISANNRFEKYNGTTWSVLTAKLLMNVDQIDGCDVNDSATPSTTVLWTSNKISSVVAGCYTKPETNALLTGYVPINGGNGTLTFGTNDSSAVNIETNNISRLSVSGTGNITISSPSSGVGLVVTATTGQNAFNAVGGAVSAPNFISTVATGTPPLTVSSTTKVTNLNADFLDGMNTASANTPSTIVFRDASGNFSAGTITASLSGNATTTTTLQTARTINGEPFDGSANINIEARLGTPIASATTTTIGTKGSGDTIHITGTATITSLGVSTTGTIRRLVFDGAVTLVHNATSLILPAGDNLTTFVGDVADFVCENGALGYWRCLNYAVANISQQEYSYLNGATGNIQTQLDTRLSKNELLMVIGNINSPLLDMPLKNSLAMKSGVGSATFTRASTATYIDRYGILKTAAIDEPRFEKEGYLNEGDSTNLLPYSEQFDNATWSKSNTTVTANTTDTTDPRGTNLADKLLDTASTTWHYMISPAASFTSGTKCTFSIFAKKGTKDVVQLVTNVSAFPAGYANFDLTNGVISAQDGLNGAKISSLSNGWYRLSITSTANTTTTATPIFISIQNSTTAAMSATYLGDGTGSVYIFGAQLEALSFATSYIPTTTGTATRSTDLLNVTREGNMPNIEVDGVVSISTDFNSFGNTTSNQWLWGLYSSASNNIGAYVSPTGTVNSNAVSIADNNSTGTTNNIKNIVQRCTQTIDNNLHTLYINGTYKSSDAGTDKRITQTQNNAYSTIRLGSYDPTVSIQGYQFFGHISNFRIWDRALTALEVTLI